MQKFDLHVPTRMLFGPEKADDFFSHVARLSKRLQLVVGKGSARSLGYLDMATSHLGKLGVEVQVFEGVEPNPTDKTINKAAGQAREFDAGLILGLGGGSVMDAAKCIAALVGSDEKDIWPFVLGQPRNKGLTAALPIATIPTTAATASEVTPNAVVSNLDIKGKSPVSYGFLKPVVSWLNPEFTVKLGTDTTRDGASDILSHVFENYLLGGGDSPLADRYSEGVIDTVIRTLPRVVNNPEDVALRGDMLWASSLALNGFHQVGRKPSQYILHAMEHALSGFYPELSHGRGLATLYPAYFRWLVKNDRALDRFNLLGQKIFSLDCGDTSFSAMSFIERFEDWLRANQLYLRLSDSGIRESNFTEIAEYCIQTYGNNGMLQALGPMHRDDIVEIYRATETQVA